MDRIRLREYLRGKDSHNLDAIDMPVSLAASYDWDASNREEILGGILRNVAKRAKAHVPFYREHEPWNKVHPEDIQTRSDLYNLPMISKDAVSGTGSITRPGVHGFREKLLSDPNYLVPENMEEIIARQEAANPDHKEILQKYDGKKILEFGSGGSQGKSTLTRLSYLTVEMESWALARALTMNGLKAGQSVACLYNNTHKGGLQLERAADIMGMPFHSKKKIFETLLADAQYACAIKLFQQAIEKGELQGIEKYAPIVRRGIREYIRGNNIQVIQSVQPPAAFSQKNAKGSALAFMSIYQEDPAAFSSLEHAFLTGFPVPKEAYTRLREDGVQVSTTWGSTEAMALGTYRQSSQENNVNALTATTFPTLGIIAWYRERDLAKPRLLPVAEGLEGILLVSSLIGAGSVYLNYRIGDKAIKTSEGYKDINRAEMIDISGSCAADALAA